MRTLTLRLVVVPILILSLSCAHPYLELAKDCVDEEDNFAQCECLEKLALQSTAEAVKGRLYQAAAKCWQLRAVEFSVILKQLISEMMAATRSKGWKL